MKGTPTMNTLRNAVAVLALAALAAAGCMLLSGQFNFELCIADADDVQQLGNVRRQVRGPEHQSVTTTTTRAISSGWTTWHCSGTTGTTPPSAVSVEAWIVPSGALNLTPVTLPGAAGATKLWGPLAIPANSTVNVDWNKSAGLFVGRQTLIDEIKGDGQFSLYLKATGAAFDVTLSNGAIIAVISAAK